MSHHNDVKTELIIIGNGNFFLSSLKGLRDLMSTLMRDAVVEVLCEMSKMVPHSETGRESRESYVRQCLRVTRGARSRD